MTELPEYAGRIRRVGTECPPPYGFLHSITLPELPEHHPEKFCNRCGNVNTVWNAPRDLWNPIMRPDGHFGQWAEIICIPCFIELAERKWGPCGWRIRRDPYYGWENLEVLQRGDQP